MLRLAAAHRGAVRAIQSFVNQQLPQQDMRRGLPTGYHELALLIRQLALVSTQIKAEKDTTDVHEDLIKMLDRVDVSFSFLPFSEHQDNMSVKCIPLNPHIYIVKLGYAGLLNLFFLIKNIVVVVGNWTPNQVVPTGVPCCFLEQGIFIPQSTG